VLFDASLLCADNDKGDDKGDDKKDDKEDRLAALEKKLAEMQVDAKKTRKNKSKYVAEHKAVCAAVNPLLPSVKELDYASLFWLTQYVVLYKKEIAENEPEVVSAYKRYYKWLISNKVKPDFDAGDVSEDAEAGEEVEESDDEAGAVESDDNED
jgi:hypothetical protein